MTETLLCVSNYSANVGYAWDFIDGLYAGVADRVAPKIRTLVAYPSIPTPPRSLQGSAARPVVLDASLESRSSIRATLELIRRENVTVLWLTDRAAHHISYPLLRRAGVRRIVVHDHTSGERTAPRGIKRVAKRVLARVAPLLPDLVVAVSDYVAKRQVEIGMIPPERVVRVWNGITAPPNGTHSASARALAGIAEDRPLVICACRATPEKGVAYLLRAFDRMARDWTGGPRPALLYCGDGPQMKVLRELHGTLAARDDITLAGYRRDAADLLGDAHVCVIPSVWHEACPLSVLEPMVRGRPVVATRVGGIPELVDDQVTGLLVPPADEPALAGALEALLRDPVGANRMGAAGRKRTQERFTVDGQLKSLTELVMGGE